MTTTITPYHDLQAKSTRREFRQAARAPRQIVAVVAPRPQGDDEAVFVCSKERVNMSFQATRFVRHLRGLSAVEKAVAYTLADHDDHNGSGITVGMSTVAEEAGLQHRQTASIVTARLVQLKVFLIDRPSKGRIPVRYLPNYNRNPRLRLVLTQP